jgi:histidyl-tRNA synthetase
METGEPDTVRDIRSGEQVPAEPQVWNPPEGDLHPRLLTS